MLSKNDKQYKSTSMLESTNWQEPIKRFNINIKKDIINHYELETINGVFNVWYIEFKSNGDENIKPYFGNIIDNHRASCKWKLHLKWKLTSYHQKTLAKVNLYILRAIT